MTPDTHDFLLPEELDKLQAALVEHMQSSGSMPLDTAHGFLTATAAHPERLSAEQACARVLGDIAAEEGVAPLLGRFRDQLLRDLENGDYGPLIMQMPREDGSVLPLPYGWCEGYALALTVLGEDLQEQLLGNEQAAARLTPIYAFLMYDQAQMFDPPDESAHREAVGELGESALWLFRWWSERGTKT